MILIIVAVVFVVVLGYLLLNALCDQSYDM